MKINFKISTFIKNKMREKGFSQKGIRKKIVRGDKVGIGSSTISELLNGGDIYVDYVFQMLKIMDVNLYWDGRNFYEMDIKKKNIVAKVLDVLEGGTNHEAEIFAEIVDVFSKKKIEVMAKAEKVRKLKKGGGR